MSNTESGDVVFMKGCIMIVGFILLFIACPPLAIICGILMWLFGGSKK